MRPEALVVEDEADVASILIHHLRRQGFDCTTVGDGESAAELVRVRHFDLAVVDIVLPGIDGVEVIEQLRNAPDGDRLPIVATTMLPPWEVNAARTDALLRKPFRAPDITRAVRSAQAAHRPDDARRSP